MTHILLIVQNNSFPSDKRVAKEALSLKQAGYLVSVISPIYGKDVLKKQEWNGINIKRYRHYESTGGIPGFVIEYSNALFNIFFISLFLWFSKPFKSIHVANPPDFFWPMGLFFKLLGVKFIFDQHDISADMYRVNESKEKNLIYKFLNWNEHMTVKCANGIITTNTSILSRLQSLYCLGNKPCEVVYNGPAADFIPKTNDSLIKKYSGKRVILYIGEMAKVDCIEIIVDTANEIVNNHNYKECVFVLLGDGSDRPRLESLANQSNLAENIEFTGLVSHELVMNYLSIAEICLVPDQPNGLNEFLTLIKSLEYMKASKPFVAMDLKETHFIAGDGALYAKDFSEYVEHVLYLLNHRDEANAIGKKGYNRVINGFLWEHQEPNLLRIYNALIGNRGTV